MSPPFRRVLIANRGEIAVRIIRACRDLEIETVAVYSEADTGALHTSLADIAVPIGAAPPGESYLNIERLVEAAQRTGCEAVHPGYGFLSERAAFARAVTEAGLVFIGPSATTIAAMGSKTEARALMQRAGVPVVPGYQEKGDLADYEAAAARIGYPILVKAAGGGGGKGMRSVQTAAELPVALESARRESAAAFGDDRVYLEKQLVAPRHIEVQIAGDMEGNLVHLFERDCSTQRRHQKVIEESPAPRLSAAVRERICDAALQAARTAKYVNVGTVEFLLDHDEQFYFLEMNTRLQVEHPVTELVVGMDLVKLQLHIAAGERLPFAQSDLMQRGHAIECRVYAEDAAAGFLPATGPLLRVNEPLGPGIRVDSGITTGDTVTHHYDPLLAKLIVWGETRQEALRILRRALAEYSILGVQTNLAFLQAAVAHPHFQAGLVTTAFLSEQFATLPEPSPPPDAAMIAAAIAQLVVPAASQQSAPPSADDDPFNPWRQSAMGREKGESVRSRAVSRTIEPPHPRPLSPGGRGEVATPSPTRGEGWVEGQRRLYRSSAGEITIELEGDGYRFAVGERSYHIVLRRIEEGTLAFDIDGYQHRASVAIDQGYTFVAINGSTYVIEPERGQRRRGATQPGRLTAVMPGQVAAVYVTVGDQVEGGQPLLLLTAMKMEVTVSAPEAGVVRAISVEVGDIVARDQPLIEVALNA